MQQLAQGAEAIITLDKGKVVKERISKRYRIKDIDLKLRKLRTRSEAKLLQKCTGIAPQVFDVDDKNMIITMEYLKGDLLKDILDTLPEKQAKTILVQLGKDIATLHRNNIIHGDLTTSNVIVQDGKPRLIDFGLGFVSQKIEDKAVDLHLLKQALTSKHYGQSEEAFAFILAGYNDYPEHEAVLKRLAKVEGRGRYKGK